MAVIPPLFPLTLQDRPWAARLDTEDRDLSDVASGCWLEYCETMPTKGPDCFADDCPLMRDAEIRGEWVPLDAFGQLRSTPTHTSLAILALQKIALPIEKVEQVEAG